MSEQQQKKGILGNNGPSERLAEVPAVAREQRFRVKHDAEVPRGGASFKLRAGKVISNLGYDIPDLLARGVHLEALST